MEVNFTESTLALISGRLKTLIFQWATIEAREWLHLERDIKINVAVATFRGQKIAEAPGCRIFGGSP